MWWKTNSFVVVALFGAVGALTAFGLEPGERFPDLTRFVLEGERPADLSGKVVVVDFWASWCAPCKASFPSYSALQSELAGRGLVIVGVSVDEKAEAFREFVRREKPAFATLRDGQQALVSRVRVPTMPTSYVIDRDGVVRFVHVGFRDGTAKRLRAEVLQLLGESS